MCELYLVATSKLYSTQGRRSRKGGQGQERNREGGEMEPFTSKYSRDFFFFFFCSHDARGGGGREVPYTANPRAREFK